jgi:hypothetical protein
MARSTFFPLPVADTSVNEVSGRPVVPNCLTPPTIPFPLYGIFRYLYPVHQRGRREPCGDAAVHMLTAES